jgi:hypothetical protein
VRLLVEIEIAQRLTVGVMDDKTFLKLLGDPGRREAALRAR